MEGLANDASRTNIGVGTAVTHGSCPARGSRGPHSEFCSGEEVPVVASFDQVERGVRGIGLSVGGNIYKVDSLYFRGPAKGGCSANPLKCEPVRIL